MKTNLHVHILLAEDNKANQKVSKAMLEAIGASVEIAENGLEVLAMLENGSFDLILMDCQMPEMDGLEATRKLRAMGIEKFTDIPVIALTADVQKDTREECLQAGMNDFLSKPFTFPDLIGTLEKWTGSEPVSE